MKHTSENQCSSVALARSLKPCLVALALWAGAVGCETTQTPSASALSQASPPAQPAASPPVLVAQASPPSPAAATAAPPIPAASEDSQPKNPERLLLREVKEVTLALDSSTFAVYATGSVPRPGKIVSDRPITAMEAVVEAGIDYSRANLKKVRVIRLENGRSEYHILNLRQALVGKPAESFDLKPSDIIYVPERFTWFNI
jgi:hypothetical protein